MTAAAGAARAADELTGAQPGTVARALALVVVVAGGLVEGAALGTLQAGALAGLLPLSRRRRWRTVTVLVAGLGWAVASAPQALSSGGAGSSAPSSTLVLAGAAGSGAALGGLLGWAQSWALHGMVAHPRRWVGANIAAWVPAMVVIFAGATLPGAAWPTLAVLVTGLVTGLVAGTLVGLVTGVALPALGRPGSGGPGSGARGSGGPGSGGPGSGGPGPGGPGPGGPGRPGSGGPGSGGPNRSAERLRISRRRRRAARPGRSGAPAADATERAGRD